MPNAARSKVKAISQQAASNSMLLEKASVWYCDDTILYVLNDEVDSNL